MPKMLGLVQPVKVLLDFIERHAERHRSLDSLGAIQEGLGLFEQQLGNFVRMKNRFIPRKARY